MLSSGRNWIGPKSVCLRCKWARVANYRNGSRIIRKPIRIIDMSRISTRCIQDMISVSKTLPTLPRPQTRRLNCEESAKQDGRTYGERPFGGGCEIRSEKRTAEL